MFGNLLISTAKFMNVLRWLMFLGVIFLFIPIIKPSIDNFEKHTYLVKALEYESSISRPLDNFLHKFIPKGEKGGQQRDITPYIKILLLLTMASFLKSLSWKLDYYGKYQKHKSELQKIKQEYVASGKGDIFNSLEGKLEELQRSHSKQDSEKLFENFMQLQQQMEQMSRYLAFLAIDIVDSTGMKEGEDRAVIQFNFSMYKNIVQSAFEENNSIKTAWTPDGVMVCFDTADEAVSAAKKVLTEVDNFNNSDKTMKRDFIMRFGINTGIVYYDESMPLEEMTDQVIDIAGHMQKHGDPSAITLSKTAYEALENTSGFNKTDKIIDDLEVYEYTQQPPPSTDKKEVGRAAP